MKKLEDIGEGQLLFNCPGCKEPHSFNIEPGPNGVGGNKPVWQFNGDMEKPTFSPSLLVRWTYGENREPRVCHSFVTDGMIQFLSDCTHTLAGQTVPLENINDD